MTKSEAIEALKTYPNHSDAHKYGYVMMWDEGRNKWIAGYEGERTAWYLWNGKEFIAINGLGSPFTGNTTGYEQVCVLASKL